MDGLFDLDPPTGSDAAPTAGGTLAGNTHASAPLAVRMRPRSLDELLPDKPCEIVRRRPCGAAA